MARLGGYKMENNKILSRLEKYSPWLRTNRRLAGPVFIISVVYILVYLVVTSYLWSVGFQMTGIQQAAYLVGFALFVIAIYLAFTGLLLRNIMRGTK
jgi:hypothetical protein